MIRKSKTSLLTGGLLATVTFAAGGAARAEEGIIKDASVHADRPTKLDFTGSLGFFGDFGVGLAGWYSLPLVKDGFIPPINDSFNLELGVAVDYEWANYGYLSYKCDYNYFGVTPIGGVRWDFYLTPSWTVFGAVKAGIGYRTVSADCSDGGGFNASDYGGTRFVPAGGVGAFWNFSPGMGMRFDLGSRGAAVGISINL